MIRLKKKSTPAPEPTAAKADEAMPDAAPAEGEKEKVSILGIGRGAASTHALPPRPESLQTYDLRMRAYTASSREPTDL